MTDDIESDAEKRDRLNAALVEASIVRDNAPTRERQINAQERVDDLFAQLAALPIVLPTPEEVLQVLADPASAPEAVTEEQEQLAVQLASDYVTGELGVGDAVIARIRTIVPLIVGTILTWLATSVPALGNFLATLYPGWQELVFAGLSAALGFGWWALAGWLGKRWPIFEKIMLGSSKRPTYVERTALER